MGRTTHRTIDELSATVSVERLVAGRGICLTERGDVLVGACPWCGQAESFVVRRPENTWACEPCGVAGGVVDWVQRIEGVSRKHAVELLRENVLGEPAGRVVRKATIPKLGGAVDADADPALFQNSVGRNWSYCVMFFEFVPM